MVSQFGRDIHILARVAYSNIAAAFVTGEEFGSARALAIGLVTRVSKDSAVNTT